MTQADTQKLFRRAMFEEHMRTVQGWDNFYREDGKYSSSQVQCAWYGFELGFDMANKMKEKSVPPGT
jgi:hypothetical protein